MFIVFNGLLANTEHARYIQNPIKDRRWNFLRDWLTIFGHLTIFAKISILDCSKIPESIERNRNIVRRQ